MRFSLPFLGAIATSMLMACAVDRAGSGADTSGQALEDDFNCHIRSRDLTIPHISTAALNAGQPVELFVREKACGGNTLDKHKRPSVLLIHGRSAYAAPSYDLQFGSDYSWMDYLAHRGFDVYALDLQGYGGSTKPAAFDNPCNTSSKLWPVATTVNQNQEIYLIPNPLAEPCVPEESAKTSFGNLNTDFAEIDTVVDYIRAWQDDPLAKVSLIGHSRGGIRVIGYAQQHPDKIEKVVAFAPGRYPVSAANAPFPVNYSSKATYFGDMNAQNTAAQNAGCGNIVEPGVQDALWDQLQSWDPLGATWGSAGVRRFPNFAIGLGWDVNVHPNVTVPTLFIRGEQDTNAPLTGVQTLYDAADGQKLFLRLSCAGHEIEAEKRHVDLHDASAQWLIAGSVDGNTSGVVFK